MADAGWIDWEDEICNRVDRVLSEAGIVLDSVNGSPEEMEKLRRGARKQIKASMDEIRDVLSRDYDAKWMQIRMLFDTATLSMEELFIRMIHHRILGNSRENVIVRFLEAYANHIGLRGVDFEMLESLVGLISWQSPDEMEDSDE